MVIRKALVALAAAGMVLGSTAAAAAPVAGARDGSPVAQSENLNFAWIIALLILLGVIGVIASDGDEDLPHSP